MDELWWLLSAVAFFAGGTFTMVWVSKGVWENEKQPPTIFLLISAFMVWWVVLPVLGMAALGDMVVARTKPQAIKDAEHDEQLRLENEKLDRQLAEAKGRQATPEPVPGSVEGFTAMKNGAWMCMSCGAKVRTARSVARHRDIAHLRPHSDGHYHCPLCSSRRSTMSALKSHYDMFHLP